MRLGVSTWAYPWAIGVAGYPPAEPMDGMAFLRRAAQLGVNVVQIGDNLPLDRLPADGLRALLDEAAALGLEIEIGTRGIAPAHLRTYLALAQQCGSSLLRVVIDTPDHHPAPDEIVATLAALLPEFAAAGVVLGIENHDRFKAATLRAMVERLDSPHVGICLDTTNSFGAEEGPELVTEVLGPYVVNLHIKDFTIRRADHGLGFIISGAPAGQGMLDIPKLLSMLQAHGRDMNAILEQWPAPEATLDATIAKEAAGVEQGISYLRTLLPE
jgi:sugar phosphate isomerase/epimerase